jgi:hypothetical protein
MRNASDRRIRYRKTVVDFSHSDYSSWLRKY